MAQQRVWVIGDIHGMFDPFNRLIRLIRLIEKGREGDCLLVFLGDYIDYGPSAREVLDRLIAIRKEFATVFLAGNHEDLLLQFLKRDDIYQRYGNIWFRGNDGHETAASLLDNDDLLQRLYAEDASRNIQPEDVKLPEKYRRFIETLKYAHREDVGRDDQKVRFAFCHGLLYSPDGRSSSDPANELTLPVEEQLALETYDQFHAYRRDRQVWIEQLHVWNRDIASGRYGDFILVHGHTPTVLIGRYYKDIGNYDVTSGLPYIRFSRNGVGVHGVPNGSITVDATLDEVATIDIDTGAVYGKCLTALLLSAEDLLDEQLITAYQVRMDCGHRHGQDLMRTEFRFLP